MIDATLFRYFRMKSGGQSFRAYKKIKLAAPPNDGDYLRLKKIFDGHHEPEPIETWHFSDDGTIDIWFTDEKIEPFRLLVDCENEYREGGFTIDQITPDYKTAKKEYNAAQGEAPAG